MSDVKEVATLETAIPDKEAARKQFDHFTKVLGLKHSFTFDEAWEAALAVRLKRIEESKRLANPNTAYRNGIMKLEETLKQTPGMLTGEALNEANPLKHTFADGCYIREIYNPPNHLLVTKIHKVAHPYFLLRGEMSILTEDGPKRIKAPYYGVTPAGTKRIIYTHSPVTFVTVHVTRQRDLAKIEEEIIANDFGVIDDLEITKFMSIVENKEEKT